MLRSLLHTEYSAPKVREVFSLAASSRSDATITIMDEFPTIRARVNFRDAKSGGREVPPIDSTQYRPHIVIGDPNQDKPLLAEDGRTLTEEYLGVVFLGDGREMRFGDNWVVPLCLFHNEYPYTKLTPGATFTVREGGQIVGSGVVLDSPFTTKTE